MTETKPKRRWFRFSLRTLLVVVTMAAVGSWAYWIGRPIWQAHRLRVEFEESAKQLTVGMTVGAAIQHMGHKAGAVGHTPVFHQNGNDIVLSQYSWPGTVYCIYHVISQTANAGPYQSSFSSVEVFRLPPRPSDYQGRYVNDFLKFISGDRRHNPDFEYELIFSAPPIK